jgi:hypothetical protein
VKLARRRSHRAYRVYADDAFLSGEDPTAEGATSEDAPLTDALPYTAPARRALPGPLAGRAGVVVVALVAMAVSALVAHALRAGLEGGGGRPAPASAPAAAAAGRRVRAPGAARRTRMQDVTSRVVSRARRVASMQSGANGANRSRSRRVRRRAVRVEAGARAAGVGRGYAEALATSSQVDEPEAAIAISTAAPEFGFER